MLHFARDQAPLAHTTNAVTAFYVDMNAGLDQGIRGCLVRRHFDCLAGFSEFYRELMIDGIEKYSLWSDSSGQPWRAAASSTAFM